MVTDTRSQRRSARLRAARCAASSAVFSADDSLIPAESAQFAGPTPQPSSLQGWICGLMTIRQRCRLSQCPAAALSTHHPGSRSRDRGAPCARCCSLCPAGRLISNNTNGPWCDTANISLRGLHLPGAVSMALRPYAWDFLMPASPGRAAACGQPTSRSDLTDPTLAFLRVAPATTCFLPLMASAGLGDLGTSSRRCCPQCRELSCWPSSAAGAGLWLRWQSALGAATAGREGGVALKPNRCWWSAPVNNIERDCGALTAPP